MRGALSATAILVAAGLALGLWVRTVWQAPLTVPDAGYVLRIEAGSSLGQIAEKLRRDGVLRTPTLFKAVARLSGEDARILRGEYRLEANTTPADLLALIQSGATVRYLVTIPEGIRLAEAIAIVQKAEGVKTTLDSVNDPKLHHAFPDAPFLEGRFLAETYQYERGTSDLDVLRQAYDLGTATLEEEWLKRQVGLPYEEPSEALIMASIIEKETAVSEERPVIAGVFVRRLHREMRLQTDPTVIYGLGSAFDGNLTRQHLRDESNPYNTYRHKGLPPTPIALPGRASLIAALHPAAGDELYFVARGDGSHEFNATLEGHEAAVRRYQLKRRADYRSSPRAER